MSAVIVWTKPACQQCRMVKHRLTTAGVWFEERDLTEPENEQDLDYFRGLGFSSAPITEYRGTIAAGFMPAEIDRIITAWKAETAEVPK